MSANEHLKRGERLFPRKSSRVYWVLTELRKGYMRLADLGKESTGATLVDYGCGNMPYRPLFEESGFKYIGYDFEGNDLAQKLIEETGMLPVPDESVDYILSSQVLEHVTDPVVYLGEAKRVLRKDGKLLLSTHGVWRYHPDPTDYWRWTGDGLKKVIEENGFRVTKIEGVIGPAATGIQLFQDAWMENVPRIFRTTFIRICQFAMAYADRRCHDMTKSKDACVFLVQAIKI